MEIRFDGKTAVLTGAARGLNKATAVMLAEGGCDVVIGDVLDEAGEKTCEEIRAMGRRAEYYHCDVTDHDQVINLFDKAGKFDFLLHGAGIVISDHFVEAPDEKVKKIFDINIMGTNYVVREGLQRLIEQKSGKIVMLGSIAGHSAGKTLMHYRMSKAAVISLAQSAALVGAEYGITVNALCPGVIRTDMWEQLIKEKMVQFNKTADEVWKMTIGNLVPMGRPQDPEDIAAMACYLFSRWGDNITGQAINVDGGAVIHP